MQAPALTLNDDGSTLLSGDLTLHTVKGLIEPGHHAIAKADQCWILDLGKVQHFSSAGVALLLAWLRICEAESKSLSIVNPPEDLMGILRVCDLEEMFAPLLNPR